MVGAGLSAQVIFKVNSPANLSATYPLSYAKVENSWGVGDLNDPAESVTGDVALVSDGTAGDSLGCNALTNGASIAGKIAVIYRGTCGFGVKALNAQNAGAIGIIIISNQDAPVTSFNMLGGTEGMSVTVPTIIIDKSTGALLNSAIHSGMNVFIGNKLGAFPVDLAYKESWVQYPERLSYPHVFARNIGEYAVKPGLFIYNVGSANQAGISATCAIKVKGGAQVYVNTQSGITCNAGDSIFVTFDTYDPNWTAGDYTITYIINPATADGDVNDNSKSQDFTLGDAVSNAITGENNLPQSNYFVKTTNPQPVFYCTSFKDDHANRAKLKGFSFAATPLAPHSLANEYLEIEMYEWNDAFKDLSEAATFDDLSSVAVTEYTYPGNYADSTIFIPWTDAAVQFKANQRYLACVKVFTDSLYFGFSNTIDYNANAELYLEPISEIQTAGTWYSSGFGFDQTSGIGIHVTPTDNSVAENAINAEGTPFPTPSNQYVNIPFAANGAKTATIQVVDVTGKIVANTTATVEGNNLKVNTTALSNGTYVFNVTLNTGKTSSFRVLVGR